MSCILCDGTEFADRYRKSAHHIRECRRCGLVQLHPLPSPGARASLYGDAYFESEDSGVGYGDYAGQEREYLATFTDDVRRIAEFVPGGSVLDVGCGYGYFLRAAAAAGYEPFGVDVSLRAVEMAARRFAGRVFEGTVDSIEALEGRHFDVIFASHVIEHLADPRAVVADLAGRLTDGGILVLITPNIRSMLARVSGSRWVSFKLPEHLAWYDPKTIARLVESAGLEAFAIDAASQYYLLPFVAQRVRELIRPVDKAIPRLEHLAPLRHRMIRVTSGSLRVIAGKRRGREA